MMPVSVCIITKNEEKNIERCLSSLIPYGFELILVDTGSADRTKELASKYTDHIYDFIWTDDFSAARNFSLSKASYDWILMIDCDETLVRIDAEELFYFQENLPQAVGSLTRENKMGEPDSPYFSTDRTERFFSRKWYHYTGRIHEQLTPLHSHNMENYLLNAVISHDGYFMTECERKQKAERNLSLLKRQLQEEPENPYIFYQLGKGYEMISDYQNAATYFSKGLAFPLDSTLAYVEAMVLSYGNVLLSLGEAQKALSLKANYDNFSHSADYIYLIGLIEMANEMYSEAADEFQKALSFQSADQEGITSWLSLYQLGSICIYTGDFEKAGTYFKQCGDYPPAVSALAILETV